MRGGSLSRHDSGRDPRDLRVEVAPPPERRRDHLLERRAADQRGDRRAQQSTGVHRPRRGMCGATRLAGPRRRLGRIRVPADRNGGEAHQRSVRGGLGVRLRINSIAGASEPLELASGRVADVEAPPVGGQVSIVLPQQIAAKLIGKVHRAPVEQRLRQAQGHRRVIGPLPSVQAERPATDHVADR